jgi:hypothetical protein
MSTIKRIIDAISSDDSASADKEFKKAIREKVNTVLDIKKIAITSEIYNKTAKV